MGGGWKGERTGGCLAFGMSKCFPVAGDMLLLHLAGRDREKAFCGGLDFSRAGLARARSKDVCAMVDGRRFSQQRRSVCGTSIGVRDASCSYLSRDQVLKPKNQGTQARLHQNRCRLKGKQYPLRGRAPLNSTRPRNVNPTYSTYLVCDRCLDIRPKVSSRAADGYAHVAVDAKDHARAAVSIEYGSKTQREVRCISQ